MTFLEHFIDKDMKLDHPKIKRIFDGEDKWFAYLLTLPDEKLERKINNINQQLILALEQEKKIETDALYLLKMLIIEARVTKMERGDEDEKPKRKRKPKVEKKTEIISTAEQNTEVIEEDNTENEESSTPIQLSLFDSDEE